MRLSPFAPIDALLAPVPDPARVGWLREHHYAHRGLHDAQRTENSPSAFRAAVAAGMGIECDIQRSRDDRPMVFHDWDFARLLGGPEDGAHVDASDWKALRYANGDAPIELGELLVIVDGRAPLLIEIKSRRGYDVERSCRLVAGALAEYAGRHAVMSFDPRVSRWFAQHSPATLRGLVVTEEDSQGWRGNWKRHAALWHARPDFLAYDVRDLPSAFAAAQRARGIPLLTWTVRSPELRERAALHADAPIAEGAGLA